MKQNQFKFGDVVIANHGDNHKPFKINCIMWNGAEYLYLTPIGGTFTYESLLRLYKEEQ